MKAEMTKKAILEELEQFLEAKDQYRFQLQHPVLQTAIMIINGIMQKKGISREQVRFMKNKNMEIEVFVQDRKYAVIRFPLDFLDIYTNDFAYNLYWEPTIAPFYEGRFRSISSVIDAIIYCGPHGERLKPIRINIDKEKHAEFERIEGMYRIILCKTYKLEYRIHQLRGGWWHPVPIPAGEITSDYIPDYLIEPMRAAEEKLACEGCTEPHYYL